jgi:hypothetical protein
MSEDISIQACGELIRLLDHAPTVDEIQRIEKGTECLVDRNLLQQQEFWYFARKWVWRAQDGERGEDDYFAKFIYLWIVFNAWGSQVVTNESKSDRDSYLVFALGCDPILVRCFEEKRRSDTEFRQLTHKFSSLWPVFKVRALNDLGIEFWSDRTPRDEYVQSVLHRIPTDRSKGAYAPPCYLSHPIMEEAPEINVQYEAPTDWAHTLTAIYKVRCNLFHGGKSFQSSRDKAFVKYAYKILWEVWEQEIPRSALGPVNRRTRTVRPQIRHD